MIIIITFVVVFIGGLLVGLFIGHLKNIRYLKTRKNEMAEIFYSCKSETFYSGFKSIIEKIEENLSEISADKIADFGKMKERFRQTNWQDTKAMKNFLSSFDSFYDERIPRLFDDDLYHSLRELIFDDFFCR